MARLISIGMTLALLLFLPGCGGCRQTPPKDKTAEDIEKEQEEREKRERERLKPDFEAKFLLSRPSSGLTAGNCWYKPGHWTCVSLEEAKANHFDFVGEMELAVTDNEGRSLPLHASPFELTISRDMALAKGQAKSLESLLFVPPGSQSVWIACRLNAARAGRRAFETAEPLAGHMPSYQYYFVVLAAVPESYGYLKDIAPTKPKLQGGLDDRAEPYYRVAMLGGRRASLPSHAEQWTSIACVLWDDASPTALEPAQQQAMLDWLHWGGQLILSGPDTLDGLHDSFLAPYLPAVATGTRKLDASNLAALGRFSGKAIRPLVPVRPWSGVRLEKHPQAEFLPGSGQLLVERRVGRGRIVASAFRLSDREFVTWDGCDEVYNAFLLRRPPRKYVETSDAGMLVQWADGALRLDAARVTQLRYFTRDTGVSPAEYAADAVNVNPDSGDPPPSAPGLAAWNDFNPVAAAARESLQNAARVEIPKRSFVMWVVVVYLLVLVPANWALFRGLRRVEWAWAAAPLIAVVCTGTVIRMAQLDIGFVRSRTELAVVEMQGDYARSHVTRYNALYTSLATSYNFQCDDPGAVMLPFPTVSHPGLFRMSLGQQFRKLTYRRGEQAVLTGFPVGSNSTGLVHSEEMLDAGGPISLARGADGAEQLVNRSALNLHGVGLVRKARSGELQTAWVGELPRTKSASGLQWNALSKTAAAEPLWARQREESPVSVSNPASGALSLRKVLDLGQDVQNLGVGETRLIGWSEDDLPGLAIEPAAPQTRRGIVVVAHLGYGFGAAPRPDVNTKDKL